MRRPGYGQQNPGKEYTGGEIEIEKIPVNDVVVRRRDLLPVFDHFHWIHSDWSDDRGLVGVIYPASSSDSQSGKEKIAADHMVSNGKLMLPGSGLVADSYTGPSRTSAVIHHLGRLDAGWCDLPTVPTVNKNDVLVIEMDSVSPSPILNQSCSHGIVGNSVSPELPATFTSSDGESYVVNSSPSPKNNSLPNGGTAARETQSSNGVVSGEVSNSSSNHSGLSMNFLDEGPVHKDFHDPLDFPQYFEEG